MSYKVSMFANPAFGCHIPINDDDDDDDNYTADEAFWLSAASYFRLTLLATLEAGKILHFVTLPLTSDSMLKQSKIARRGRVGVNSHFQAG